jgi:hypothetical protein
VYAASNAAEKRGSECTVRLVTWYQYVHMITHVYSSQLDLVAGSLSAVVSGGVMVSLLLLHRLAYCLPCAPVKVKCVFCYSEAFIVL